MHHFERGARRQTHDQRTRHGWRPRLRLLDHCLQPLHGRLSGRTHRGRHCLPLLAALLQPADEGLILEAGDLGKLRPGKPTLVVLLQQLPAPLRRDSGYRDYDERDLQTLRFIGHARDLGFPIEEIRQLLALWQQRDRASADVKSLALARAAELKRKARALDEMRRSLEQLAATWPNAPAA